MRVGICSLLSCLPIQLLALVLCPPPADDRLDAPLPWDHIDTGIAKWWLKADLQVGVLVEDACRRVSGGLGKQGC